MKLNTISHCLIFTAIFLQSSSLNAQTECELLERPPAPGGLRFEPHDMFYRVREVLTTQRLALLTQDQRDEIQEVQNRFRDIIIQIDAEAAGRPDAEDFAANEEDKRVDLAAPQLVADLQQALGADWADIVFEVNRRLASGYGDPSGLSLSTVVEGLHFSIDQQNEAERLRKKAEATADEKKSELAKSLKSLLEEHFSDVKAELDTVQQTRFLGWFGDLKMFERFSFSGNYRDLVSRISQQQGRARVVENFVGRIREPGEPKERRDVEIDSLLYLVLTMRDIEQQLTLSPEQTDQINAEIRGNDVRLIVKDNRIERLESILSDKWELPDWLDKIMLPHQKNWLKEFEFQVYILPYADSFGLLYPDVSKELKLTPDQKNKLSVLASNYRARVTDLTEKTNQAILQANQKTQAQLLKLLTPEQMVQYRRWFGDAGLEK